MNGTERRELRNVIDGRMTMVKEGIALEAAKAREQVRRDIEAQYDVDLAMLKRKTEKLADAAHKLVEQGRALSDEAGTYGFKPAYLRDGSVVEMHVHRNWVHDTMHDRIRRATTAVDLEEQEALRALNARHLELREAVALDAITSERGRELLAEIPNAHEMAAFDMVVVEYVDGQP